MTQNKTLLFPAEIVNKPFEHADKKYFICVNCWLGSFAVCLMASSDKGKYTELVKSYWFEKPQAKEVVRRIEKLLSKKTEAKILINSTSWADIIVHALARKNIKVGYIHWNGQCFGQKNREKYSSRKSQAYFHLSEAFAENHFKISTIKHKDIIVDQLSKVGHEITRDKKHRITPHTADSASFVDNIAYLFLEGVMSCGK